MDLHCALHWVFSFQFIHETLNTTNTSYPTSSLNLFGKKKTAKASRRRGSVSQSHMRRIHWIKKQFRHKRHCQKAQTSPNTIRHHTTPIRNSLIWPNTYTSSLKKDQFKFKIISRELVMFWTQASILIVLSNKMLRRKPVTLKISLCMIYKVIFIQFQPL